MLPDITLEGAVAWVVGGLIFLIIAAVGHVSRYQLPTWLRWIVGLISIFCIVVGFIKAVGEIRPGPLQSDATPIPTLTEISVSAPSNHPLSQGLGNNCINSDTWTPYESNLLQPPTDGCWKLPDSWGIIPGDSSLAVFRQDVVGELYHAIYRPIGGQATVSLSIKINEITVDAPFANIFFTVSSMNPEKQPIKGLFYQLESLDYPVLLKSEEVGDKSKYLFYPDGNRVEYQVGAENSIVFELGINDCRIYVNQQLVLGPFEIPSANRAFWIGYHILQRGSIDAQIYEIRVENK